MLDSEIISRQTERTFELEDKVEELEKQIKEKDVRITELKGYLNGILNSLGENCGYGNIANLVRKLKGAK